MTSPSCGNVCHSRTTCPDIIQLAGGSSLNLVMPSSLQGLQTHLLNCRCCPICKHGLRLRCNTRRVSVPVSPFQIELCILLARNLQKLLLLQTDRFPACSTCNYYVNWTLSGALRTESTTWQEAWPQHAAQNIEDSCKCTAKHTTDQWLCADAVQNEILVSIGLRDSYRSGRNIHSIYRPLLASCFAEKSRTKIWEILLGLTEKFCLMHRIGHAVNLTHNMRHFWLHGSDRSGLSCVEYQKWRMAIQ